MGDDRRAVQDGREAALSYKLIPHVWSMQLTSVFIAARKHLMVSMMTCSLTSPPSLALRLAWRRCDESASSPPESRNWLIHAIEAVDSATRSASSALTRVGLVIFLLV